MSADDNAAHDLAVTFLRTLVSMEVARRALEDAHDALSELRDEIARAEP